MALVCRHFEITERANKLRSPPKTGAGPCQHPKDHGHSHLSGFWKRPCALPQKNEQP